MMSRRNLVLGAAVLGTVGSATYLSRSGQSYEDAVNSIWTPAPAKNIEPSNSNVKYLVHYATLAANSHNTQPWRFKSLDHGVSIRPDLGRTTPIVDPDNHHLFVSLGCACENLTLAAAADGKSSAVSLINDKEIHIDLASGISARDALFDAIIERQCTRSDYDRSMISPTGLNTLEQSARIEGCQVILVTDRAKINSILELILAGNSAQMSNPAFRKELKDWLRFNSASALETKDGLYAACSGNPTMQSWLGNFVFDFVFTSKIENEKCARQVKSSSGLAIFVADANDNKHWIQAGRSYQRFALQATTLGLKHAFLNQAVEVPEVRSQLAALLGIGDKRPNLLVRFGKGPTMPRSMRRPLVDVIDEV
jgi:hypothetical protein